MLPTVKSLQSEICVLDVEQYSSLDELRRAAEASVVPSLLLINRADLSEVLTWLDEQDDVCLRDCPPELIAHRARRLKLGVEALLDPLTRVFSRRPFDQALSQAAVDAAAGQPVSLLLCDLDRFKSANDRFGHHAGDELLMMIANVLKQNCDRSATVGRIKGQSFAIVCQCDEAAALALADELREKANQCETREGASVTLSFGVATVARSMDSHQLMQFAEQALYAAKASGRDNCVSYADLQAACRAAGHDVDLLGLEYQARVLADRVAGFISMRSRQIIRTVRKEADIDGLTKCFNRRYLDRRLEFEFDSRGDCPLTIAFIDLDHFGEVNKQHGWPTGDKLLVEICDTLRSNTRSTDWIGRYGGEEFCVVMPDTKQSDATAVLSRIRKLVESKDFRSTNGDPVDMTLSIGTATSTATDTTYSDLLDRACGQAQQAKQNGRNQLCVAE